MSKNRIYISGGITGIPDYMERFAKAQEKLEKQGYSVINPALVNSNLPEDTTYEEYMKVSFCLLNMCDSIYMMNGWDNSCGASREYGYACAGGMTIIFESRDKKND